MTDRLFSLVRDADPSGVSGTGIVATGVEFADGTCVIHWGGEHRSTCVFASVADIVAIHGHHGATHVEFARADWRPAVVAANAEKFRKAVRRWSQ